MCFFIRRWDVVLTYTVTIAAMDMKCRLKNSSNVCECVTNLVTETDSRRRCEGNTARARVGKPVGLKTSWLVTPELT